MEFVVEKDLCIGCGTCYNIDDEIFAFDDDGKAEVVKQPVGEESLASAMNALEYCPTNAIITKGEKNAKCEGCSGCCH